MTTEKEIGKSNNVNIPEENLEYHSPTPGEITLMTTPIAQYPRFEILDSDVEIEENFTPYVPDEPEDPSSLDDRQNVLNATSMGCNLCASNISVNHMDNMHRYMYKKISHLGNNSDLEKNPEDLFNKHIDTQGDPANEYRLANKGFTLGDEPSMDTLHNESAETNYFKNYWKIRNALESSNLTKKLLHINLLPIHGFKSAKKYQEYLDTYQTYYKPSHFSFDVYPVLQNSPVFGYADMTRDFRNLEPGTLIQVHERFYRTMEMVARMSRITKRPMWSYVLTSEHFSNNFVYPIMLESFIRYQAFTALAYGAKGLCFFRYLQDSGEGEKNLQFEQRDNYESYITQPLNADRTRTPVWYFTRTVISEIKRYEQIFLSSVVRGVFHTYPNRLLTYAKNIFINSYNGTMHGDVPTSWGVGIDYDSNAYWGLREFNSSRIAGISSILSEDGGPGVLVSHLVPAGGSSSLPAAGKQITGDTATGSPGELDIDSEPTVSHVLVVNHDAVNYQKISITFRSNVIVTELTPRKSGATQTDTPLDLSGSKKIERMLTPGGYLLFKLYKPIITVVP